MKAEDFFKQLEEERPAFREAWGEEEPSSNLASNVYRMRKERGWTQRDLAQRARMKQPKIARIEAGDANPELRTLGRLAAAFGVSAARLLWNPEEEPMRGAAAEVREEIVRGARHLDSSEHLSRSEVVRPAV